MKLRLLFFGVLFCFLTIIAKLFYIQIIDAHSYEADYVTTKKLLPERGKILDVHRQPLAVNETKYLLYVEPKKVDKISYTAKDIDTVLHLGEATIEARIDPTKDWVKIASGVTKEQKETLQKMKTAGIGFQDEADRFYPEASLSAHLLGFVGKDSEGQNVGYFGVEGYYEKELAGLTGLVKSERDLIGRPIFFGTQEKVNSENGGDIVLTIDNGVQAIVKKKLVAMMETTKAKEGCVIIADPYSMAIRSMACLPDFDPEHYADFTQDVFRNPAISDTYEPGSTFKPLVMAAALEEKAIKPDETMDETGPVEVSGYTIKTWNEKYGGKTSMTQILERSSNVGMVYIGNKLGPDKLYEYIQKYHFGKRTDIDLQGEASSNIRPKDEWHTIDFATATFGQGIAVTPIQMVRAFAALVNGGTLMEPHIVDRIISGDRERVNESRVIQRVISERTSEIIKKMLVSTVENGEIKFLKPKGFTVGGKTGTAQIPVQGRYDATKTIASFVGFAPADKPKFIGMVVFREPQSSEWGAETAAPLFFDIAKDLLLYYNIAPGQ